VTGVKGSEYTVQDTWNVDTPDALGVTFIVHAVRNANLVLQQRADVSYCLYWEYNRAVVNYLWTARKVVIRLDWKFDTLLLFISVIIQLDAQHFCFTISLFRDSTCFEHMCSKHVEAWNKLIVKQKYCASSWLITEINILRCTVSKTSEHHC